MDPQQPTFNNSRYYGGTGQRHPAHVGGMNLSGQEPGVGRFPHNNNSVARLPGLGRQVLSSRSDLSCNNAQVTGDKRARDSFESGVSCGQRATTSFGQQPGSMRAPARSMPEGRFESSAAGAALATSPQAYRTIQSRVALAPMGTVSHARAKRRQTYAEGDMDETAADYFGYFMNSSGRWEEKLLPAQRASSSPPSDNLDSGAQQTDREGDAGQSCPANDSDACSDAQLRQEDDGEGLSQTRMSPRYKLILLRKTYEKMRKPGNWRWKTVKSAWEKGGIKELVDESLEEWLKLPEQDRTKYGGDSKGTKTPKPSTFMQFMSTEKKKCRTWNGGSKTTTSASGQYWRDASLILDDIQRLDACESFLEPDDAKAFAMKATAQRREERGKIRKAKQEATGNVTEVMEGLQQSARELAEPIEATKEIQREQIDLCKANNLEMKAANIQDREDAAGRARARDDREKTRVKEREESEKARAKEREESAKYRRESFEHGEKLINLLDESFPALPKDATLPWPSYAEFWEDLPSVGEEQRSAIETMCPAFKSFVKLGRAQKFGNVLYESTGGVLVRFTANLIAATIHEGVYET